MNSPEVKQSLQMAEQLANDPEALAKFQSQLAEALGALLCVFPFLSCVVNGAPCGSVVG